MLGFLCLCLIFCLLKSYECYGDYVLSSSRVKRVIGGIPVLYMDSEYRAVKFTVWISSGHNCESFTKEEYLKRVEKLEREGNYDVILNDPISPCAANPLLSFCGGSLLTGTIVQTACHCLVTFQGAVDGYHKAVTASVWEEMYDIYPGAVDVKTVTGAKAKNYLRHPSCTKHEKSFTTLHDYGLIVLRKPLAGKEISYAPVYTIATLAELWTRSMAESSVCLNLGFGEYLLSEKGPLPETAPALMHGWVRMMDWLGCYEQSSPKGLVGNWNYTNEATWFCTKRLPSKQQNQGKGDSGSPVTCNNQYTGIIAATWTYEKPFRYLFSTSMSTAFSVLENSAEYRKGLILSVALYEFDSKIKVFFYRPTTEPIRMYRSVFSNCQSPSATLCTFLVWVSLSALYVAYENIFLKCL